MSEAPEPWRTFAARSLPANPNFADPELRAMIIERVIEIADRFMMTTVEALTRMTSNPRRALPPGGESYCLEDWLQPHSDDFDGDVDLEYDEAFAASWHPPDQAIVAFLARHDLKLRDAKDAPRFHQAWIGKTASRCAGSLLIGLQTPKWQGEEREFSRLAPLLERRLDAGFCSTLVMTLFWLSKSRALAELERPHGVFVRSLLEQEAS